MTEGEPTSGTTEIEQTIGRMEQLYQALTGSTLPRTEAPYAPIPAEKDPAEHVERQLNRLLTMLADAGGEVRPVLVAWTPPMSVWQSHTEIRICVDLPGVPRDHVQVVAQGKLLTITGNRAVPKNDDDRLHSSEMPFGPFRRTVYIPGGMRETEPRAEMKDGVLEIVIQKESSQVTTPKTVRVN
jgi:HSP20 family protein